MVYPPPPPIWYRRVCAERGTHILVYIGSPFCSDRARGGAATQRDYRVDNTRVLLYYPGIIQFCTQRTQSPPTEVCAQVEKKTVKMFYPEFSPAMKWHFEQNQKLYTNFMFTGQSKQQQQAFDQYHGEFSSGQQTDGITLHWLYFVFTTIQHVGKTSINVFINFFV